MIRIWERRYRAVSPRRTESNRRLFSDEEIERLKLLKRNINIGRSIGQIARLPDEELKRLLEEELKAEREEQARWFEDQVSQARRSEDSRRAGRPAAGGGSDAMESLVSDFIRASEEIDDRAPRRTLLQAKVQLGRMAVVEEYIPTLMREIGELWSHGALRVFQEHVASETIRTFLGEILDSLAAPEGAPAAVAALPPRQLHELGLLTAAVAAASDGWKTTYLGADTPIEEIAKAVEVYGARVALLSITYPEDDYQLVEDLRELRALVPEDAAILIGGRAASSYVQRPSTVSDASRSEGGAGGIRLVADASSLHEVLAELRRSAAPAR